MTKRQRLRAGAALVISPAILALGLSACGSSNTNASSAKTTPTTSKTTPTSSTSSPSSQGQSSHIRVAVLTPGEANDGSWGQAVTEGAKTAAKKYGITLTTDHSLTGATKYEQAGASFASKGYTFVIMANGSYPTVLVKLGKQFPKTFFCEISVKISTAPANVCSIQPTYYDGDFLAGALAAMVSKSQVLGTINGYNFPGLNWEPNAFNLGARYINPKVKLITTYINTWLTVAAARSAAQAQMSEGADVIFSATDQATEGIYTAAKGHNVYVIPQYFDNHAQAPGVVLTSVLFNLQGAMTELISMYVNHTIKNKYYVLPYKTGAGKLAPFYTLAPSVVTPAIQSRLSKIEAMIASGKLTVPALGKAGQGKTYDLSQLPPAPAAS